MPVRIAIIDDHVLLRQALESVLSREPDLVVAWGASSAADALGNLDLSPVDVAIVDLAMPEVDGLELVRTLASKATRTRILMLTMFGTQANARDAFASGATGFATKNQSLSELLVAVRTVAAGRRYLSAGVTLGPPRLLGDPVGGAAALSRREREVLSLVVDGKTTKDIAEALRISKKTVETHRSSVNRKLGVHSVGELMRFAAAHGRLHP